MSKNTIEVVGEGEVVLGHGVTVGPGAKVVFHRPATITIGDYCVVGAGVKFIVDGGLVQIGDWTSLHDNCLVLSKKGVQIGQHSWFGQNTVLDGSGGLTIGNGVRIGMYSQIWSHVAAGERIEGCTLFGERPVVIEDDVWLVGSCICASGVTVGSRTVALIGSNITKSCPSNLVIAGSPAQPKEGLSFYRAVSHDEKWTMLAEWLTELESSLDLERVATNKIGVLAYRWGRRGSKDLIVFAKTSDSERAALAQYPHATICNLETKRYLKTLSELEHRVLKALAGNKVRFLH